MPKRLAIIQARMGSSRLPGKVLQPLAGEPMLARIVARVGAARSVDAVVVATSDRPQDDVIAAFCGQRGSDCFRGSEKDVLDRFYQAALSREGDPVLRITADCPCADPKLIDGLYDLFIADGLDHAGVATGAGAAMSRENRWPDGMDAEWMSFAALRRAAEEADTDLEREHVTPFIWRRPQTFKLGLLYAPEDYSTLRLTVDNPLDFQLISDIYEHHAPNGLFGLKEILELFAQKPELAAMNRNFIGTEGYGEFYAGKAP